MLSADLPRDDIHFSPADRYDWLSYLAFAFHDQRHMESILLATTFPRARIPAWDGTLSAVEWWAEILSEIDCGVIQAGNYQLLTAAVRIYSGNRVFLRLANTYLHEPPACCHVIIQVRTAEAGEQAQRTLRELQLDPVEHWSTARAVSYRVSSADTEKVRTLMTRTGFDWTVVQPGAQDYLLQRLYVEGPDGRQYQVTSAPAQRTVGELVADMVEGFSAGRPTVIDLVGRSGQGHRLDPKSTLVESGVGDGDRLRVYVSGHAFISYARKDSRDADRLQQALERGVPVWRDTADLWPGEDWRAEIRRAITHDALVFLACFSHSSLARKVSYQNEELALAIEQMRLRRPGEPWLIPVRFDDCDVPDIDIGGGRSLASIQRADLFGEPPEESFARLTTAVLRILGHDAHFA